MTQPVLDRPVTPPDVAPTGPGNADGYPTTNARGQIRGPSPGLEPEVKAAIERNLAKDYAALKRAEAIEAADAEITATTGEADAIPVVGWAAAAIEAGTAITEGVIIYKLLKDIAKLEEELRKAKAKTDADTNVQVKGKPCLVDEYQNLKKICGGEAHHIMPDMVYRLGARPTLAADMSSTANRIPNAPTFNQGMAICLTDAQHSGLHSSLKTAMDGLGATQTPAGTAPIGKIAPAAAASITAIPDLPAACKALAVAKLAAQIKQSGLRSQQPGRTQQAPLPSGDAATVLRRGSY